MRGKFRNKQLSTDAIWEVIGYGTAKQQISGQSREVLIEILLAEPDDQGLFPEWPSIQSCWIGCGQLETVPIGSRWQKGRRVGMREIAAREASVSLVSEAFWLNKTVKTARTEYFPTPYQKYQRFFELALNGGEPAIVPVVELIRALFGVSSGFLKQLFDGQRDPPYVTDRPLFDRKRSRYDAQARKMCLYCINDVTRLEARIAGAVFADDTLKRAHNRVFASFQRHANWKAEKETPIVMSYPFAGDRHWRFRSMPIRSQTAAGERDILLITKIDRLEMQYPFERLEVNVPEPPKREACLPPQLGRLNVAGGGEVELDASRNPGFGSQTRTFEETHTSFEDAFALEVVVERRPPESGPLGRMRVLFEPGPTVAPGSTGDRRPGADASVLAARINRVNEGVVDWHEIERRWIATANAVRALPIDFDLAGDYRELPLIEVKKGHRALMMEIVVEGSAAIMLVDAGSQHSLGIIRRENFQRFGNHGLQDMKDFVLQNSGAWTTVPNGYQVRRLVRPVTLYDDVTDYAERIAGRIRDLCK
ncbi:MAG: hypothetical protein KDJ44_09825 [Rhodoblastus sp.]|nr:hypothetical protein [Rhodoblastus sp.]